MRTLREAVSRKERKAIYAEIAKQKANMKKRILILCTGNSCRSQMAEGFIKSLNSNLEVYSAGTKPADKVNPFAVKVMSEVGIDISSQYPQNVDEFIEGIEGRRENV